MNNISHVTINSVCSGENPGEKGEKLKQPKKPTRAQKEILSKNKLKPENWMMLEEDKYQIVFISKRGNRRRIILNEQTKARNRKKHSKDVR